MDVNRIWWWHHDHESSCQVRPCHPMKELVFDFRQWWRRLLASPLWEKKEKRCPKRPLLTPNDRCYALVEANKPINPSNNSSKYYLANRANIDLTASFKSSRDNMMSDLVLSNLILESLFNWPFIHAKIKFFHLF